MTIWFIWFQLYKVRRESENSEYVLFWKKALLRQATTYRHIYSGKIQKTCMVPGAKRFRRQILLWLVVCWFQSLDWYCDASTSSKWYKSHSPSRSVTSLMSYILHKKTYAVYRSSIQVSLRISSKATSTISGGDLFHGLTIRTGNANFRQLITKFHWRYIRYFEPSLMRRMLANFGKPRRLLLETLWQFNVLLQAHWYHLNCVAVNGNNEFGKKTYLQTIANCIKLQTTDRSASKATS